MSIQDDLNAFVAQIKLAASGASTPGSLINVSLNPDPLQTGLSTDETGVTRTIMLLKMLRFADASLPDTGTSITDFIDEPGQVSGGQPMPAISVQLPGPPVSGTDLTPQPLLGGADPESILAGVPGMVGVIESRVSKPLPLSVSLRWTFEFGGRRQVVDTDSVSSLSVVPPVMFTQLGSPGAERMLASVTGTIAVHNPVTGAILAQAPINLPGREIMVAAIPVPSMLCLFTWPGYGTQPAQDKPDAHWNSVLVMLPPDSPVSDPAAAVTQTRNAIEPLTSLLSAPLPPGTAVPFGSPETVLQQLSALLAGLNLLSSALTRSAPSGTVPLMVAKGTVGKGPDGPNGRDYIGVRNIGDLFFYTESPWKGQAYHDNSRSFLWLSPPGTRTVIYRDTDYQSSDRDLSRGRMTITAGSTCLAGISDFRAKPDQIDPGLSPHLPPLQDAATDRRGWFGDKRPPHSQYDQAWTDSFEFQFN